MNNKNGRLLPFVVCGLPLAILCAMISLRSSESIHSIEADITYTITLDSGYAPEGLSTTPITGTFLGPKNVMFYYEGVTINSGGLLRLESNGTLTNNDQITSITSYNVVFSGDCRISFCWDYALPIESYAQGDHLQSGITYPISNDYYYFMLSSNSGVVDITSVTIGYSCIPTPAGPEFTLAFDGLSYIVTGYTKQPYDLEIPDTYNGLPVTEIAPYAFSSIYNLNSVIIPDSVVTIGEYAFYDCQNLNDVTLPTGLVELPAHIFDNCASLSGILLPETLQIIGDYSFSNSGLNTIEIPSSVTIFGTSCFSATQYLEGFSFNEPIGVNHIAMSQFEGSGLFSIDLPEGIESIGFNAFAYSAIEDITFPSTLTTIEDYAFYQCNLLASFYGTLSNVIEIGSEVFENTAWLNEQLSYDPLAIFDGRIVVDGRTISGNLTLPAAITHIAGSAFYENSSLLLLETSANLEKIGKQAFANCSSLSEVDFSDSTSLLYIEQDAFAECTALATMSIPTSVIGVGDDAFYNTAWLSSQTGPGIILMINDRVVISGNQLSGAITLPSTITAITSNAFRGSSITAIDLPEGMERISHYAFFDCDYLSAIDIPDTVTFLGSSVLSDCGQLANANVGTGVEYLLENCFSNSTSLSSVTLPLGLLEIGASAFDGCNALSSISLPTGLQNIGYRAFSGTSALTTINVPSTIDFIRQEVFALSGLQTLTLNSGLSVISDSAFSGCAALTSINLPETLLSIGNEAFRGCEALTTITIPIDVSFVGWYCFDGCSVLSINAATSSLPETWNSAWNPNGRPVVWGYGT